MATIRNFSNTQFSDRTWAAMVALSVACHLAIMSGVALFHKWEPLPVHELPSVEVDLVSMPAHKQERPAPKARVEPATPPKPVTDPIISDPPVTAPKPQTPPAIEKQPLPKMPEPPAVEPVILPKKPITLKASPVTAKEVPTNENNVKKEPEKNQIDDASKAISEAIAKIQKQQASSESRPETVLDAIRNLEKRVDSQANRKPAGQAAGTRSGGDGQANELTDKLMAAYYVEVWHRIKKNWAFSSELGRAETNLEAVIIAKIMKNGELKDMWFEKRSGNAYFDDSALRAMKKSNPLPPLPDTYPIPYCEIGFRFNPSDLLKKN